MKRIFSLTIILFLFLISNIYGIKVTFKYKNSNAKNVFLAGDFNNWNKSSIKMIKTSGVWRKTLDLEPGEYAYKFIVDGKWTVDKKAKKFKSDGYGGKNSIIIVKEQLNPNEKPPYQSVNLTGSFNNWNQADKKYKMKFIGDNTYEITKLFYPGTYTFKFNMDGTWNVNFGIGKNGKNSLAKNGDNIKISIEKPGYYKIYLYLNRKKYKIEKVPPIAPIAFAIYKKYYYVTDYIYIDASKSIPRKNRNIKKYLWKQAASNPYKICPCKLKKKTIKTKISKPGFYKFSLTVNDGIKSKVYKISFEVLNKYSIKINNKTEDLKYKGNGYYEKVLTTKKQKPVTCKLIKNNSSIIEKNIRLNLKKGKFYLFSYNEKTKNYSIQKKNFAHFYFDKRKYPKFRNTDIRSVAAVGSFNNWNTAETFLEKNNDGTFELYLPLEEGLYSFKYVINGTKWVADKFTPKNLRESDGFGGYNSGIYVGDNASDFGIAKKSGINWQAVEHNSSDMKYFNVLGKKLIEIKIRTIQNDVDKVVLIYFNKNKKKRALLSSKYTKFGFDYFENNINIEKNSKLLKYYFVLYDKNKKYYYGKNYSSTSAPPKNKYFSSIIKIKFPTPDWAKGIVWYQIMVDRFRNGNKSNDPACTIPWRWEWFKKYKCEKWDDKKWNDKRYGFYGWEGVWNRFFGGDLQGLKAKLKYLKDLGVRGIYLNPIFESDSHHKYDTTDYRHVDDNFGYKGDNKNLNETENPKTWKWTKTDKLFLEIVKLIHSMGMRIIVDGVFNHSGYNFWAFQDVVKNKQKSRYKDWYVISSWNPFKYEGWGGFGGLPVYKEDSNGLVQGIREHIFNITKRWLNPIINGKKYEGIDGWRLDVPNEVNINFWRDWRKVVKSANPNAYITGEIWQNAAQWLKGDAFDAVMNYEFTKRVYRFFIDTKKPLKYTASEFDKSLKDLLSSYPMQVNLVMQNLLDSHDTDRITSGINNPNRDFDAKNRPQDNGPNYNMKKPGKKIWNIFKLIQIFQFTFVGAPMIYYGDEVGMWSADDPNNRQPMLWKDLMPYNDKKLTINKDILNNTKKLAKIHNQYEALKTGTFNTLTINDKKEIYGYIRSSEFENIYIVLNNKNIPQTIIITVNTSKKDLKDVLNNKIYKVRNGKLKLKLKSKYGAILVDKL